MNKFEQNLKGGPINLERVRINQLEEELIERRDKLRSKIATEFRSWMKENNYSRRTAGQAIGVNPNTLSTWVRDIGERRSSIDVMVDTMIKYNII